MPAAASLSYSSNVLIKFCAATELMCRQFIIEICFEEIFMAMSNNQSRRRGRRAVLAIEMIEERILLSHGVIPGPRTADAVLIEAARRQRLPLSGNLSGGFSYQTTDGLNYLITVTCPGWFRQPQGRSACDPVVVYNNARLPHQRRLEQLDRTRADVSDHRPGRVNDGRWHAQHRTQIETLAVQDHGKHHRRHRSVRRRNGKPHHPGHTVLAGQQRAQGQASRHGRS